MLVLEVGPLLRIGSELKFSALRLLHEFDQYPVIVASPDVSAELSVVHQIRPIQQRLDISAFVSP